MKDSRLCLAVDPDEEVAVEERDNLEEEKIV
jgi:hypothetical protein